MTEIHYCLANWDGTRCNRGGVHRLVVNNHSFSLTGMQTKLQAEAFYICDECWPRAKPYILQMLGHTKEAIDEALAEAGMGGLE